MSVQTEYTLSELSIELALERVSDPELEVELQLVTVIDAGHMLARRQLLHYALRDEAPVDALHSEALDDAHRNDADDAHRNDADDPHRNDADDAHRNDADDAHRNDVLRDEVLGNDAHRNEADDPHRNDVLRDEVLGNDELRNDALDDDWFGSFDSTKPIDFFDDAPTTRWRRLSTWVRTFKRAA